MARLSGRISNFLSAMAVAGLSLVGCGNDDSGFTPVVPPLAYSVAAPESLLRALEIIYNDRTHSAVERQGAYADLFDPAFVFHFQSGDIESYGMPRAWPMESEFAASDSLFRALELGTSSFLSLEMEWTPAADLDPPIPGREDWKEVFASRVDCTVLVGNSYTLGVTGGQARFFARPGNGRWYLVEWIDLPRPFSRGVVEPSSWGTLKAAFHSEPLEPFSIPGYAAPESLIATIETIYNDTWQPSSRRSDAYRNLFADEFQFHFQPEDVANGLPESWSWIGEHQSNRKIFRAQDWGQVLSLALDLECDPAIDLDPPQPGREGWKEIFCRSVHLRLMFNLDDGLEIDGDQERFLLKPADGRWYLADWTDLPSPQSGLRVGSRTWGNLKHSFLTGRF